MPLMRALQLTSRRGCSSKGNFRIDLDAARGSTENEEVIKSSRIT